MPPNIELITKRYEKGQARLSRFFAAFDEAEMYYEGNWEPSGPEAFPKTTPATASAIIEEATDHIDTEHITPHVPTIGKKQKGEEEAGKLKGFIQGIWNYWSSHAEDIPPPRDFTRPDFWKGDYEKRITYAVENHFRMMPQIVLSPEQIKAVIHYTSHTFGKLQ